MARRKIETESVKSRKNIRKEGVAGDSDPYQEDNEGSASRYLEPQEFWSYVEDVIRLAIAFDRSFVDKAALQRDIPARKLVEGIASLVKEWRERRNPDFVPMIYSSRAREPLFAVYERILSLDPSKELAKEMVRSAIGQWYSLGKVEKYFALTAKKIEDEKSRHKGMAGLVADRLGEAHGVSGTSIERYWRMGQSEMFSQPVSLLCAFELLRDPREAAKSKVNDLRYFSVPHH